MPDLLADLNEPQRQAVCHVDGPLLILAGAGSGKTRVITRRVAYLIQRGVAPWNILAITFTNKAAGEMRQRVEALHAPRGATVSTFHALCARLLREFAPEAGLDHNYSIYDRDDQLRVVKEAVGKLSLKTGNFPPAGVLSAISRAKNALKGPAEMLAELDAEDAPGGSFYARTAAEVYAEYQRTLAENNALDFDDLLLRMAFLLRDHPDLRELLGRRYRYVLIDEYQDTNRAQYILAHGIAMDHENLAVTGDPDQSIYAWRGADIRNILEFEADYPDATVIRLEENYRSTQPILTAASTLIAHNRMRKEKALWTRRTGGQNVRVVLCDDEHAEAAEIARRVLQRQAAGGRLDEVAVFYRVNSLSRVLEDVFRKSGVAYRIARGVEFYNRKEVKDVLAYLRLLVNPADDLSCVRTINTPPRGIGAVTVRRLAQAADMTGRGLLEMCGHAEDVGLGKAAAAKVRAFRQMIAGLTAQLDRPLKRIVEAVLAASGLEEALDDGEESKQARANVGELVTSAAEFQQENEQAALADFLHQVALVSDTDHFDGSTGAVTFMTLHAAKGLEFPAVFVVGCEDGLLPMVRMDAPRDGQAVRNAKEEERRLAFVGMTRAKDELVLTCARRRQLRGVSTAQVASPFLEEIGGETVTFEDATTDEDFGGRHGSHRSRRAGRGGFYDDVEAERAAIERAMDVTDPIDAEDLAPDDVPEPPAEYRSLKVNCRIRHPRFGPGKVIGLRNHWPETRAEILFDESGPKTIWLKYTRLEVLDDWP